MAKIVVLGAAGKIARLATDQFLKQTNDDLTFYLRKPKRLKNVASKRIHIVEGDANNTSLLEATVRGHDVVYANLEGDDIENQAKSVVAALTAAGVRRLIWISTLGIYDKVPGAFGKWNHEQLDDGYLPTYAAAAKVIEASGLDYTIVRPAWLTDTDEIDYELTQKGDAFKGTEVSRKSVADFVVKLAHDQGRNIRASIGVNKPGTEGDMPAWYR